MFRKMYLENRNNLATFLFVQTAKCYRSQLGIYTECDRWSEPTVAPLPPGALPRHIQPRKADPRHRRAGGGARLPLRQQTEPRRPARRLPKVLHVFLFRNPRHIGAPGQQSVDRRVPLCAFAEERAALVEVPVH